jgi:hypothetical protein
MMPLMARPAVQQKAQ